MIHLSVRYACTVAACALAITSAGSTGNAAPKPHSLRQKPHQSTPAYPLGLTPLANGPGILICEPTCAPNLSQLADFGAACGRWLEFTVAGQPMLSKTPSWRLAARVAHERGHHDLRLQPQEALALSQPLGLTHLAVGTITGSLSAAHLDYQLWRTGPGGTAAQIGDYSIDGDGAGIIAGLPDLARKLLSGLGESAVNPPDPIDLTPNQMMILGGLPFPLERPPYSNSVGNTEDWGLHNPFALLATLYPGQPDVSTRAALLLKMAPDNPLIYAGLPESLAPMLKEGVDRLRVKYPANATLNAIHAALLGLSGDTHGAYLAERTAVRCNPDCAAEWYHLADDIGNDAQSLRRARTYDAMVKTLSPSDLSIVLHSYQLQTEAAQQAVRLDPLEGRAWLQVSVAAAFNGNGVLADQAYARAVVTDSDEDQMYWWGLQLYQPKWYDDPRKLSEAADRAAARKFTQGFVGTMVNLLTQLGFDKQAQTFMESQNR